MKWRKIMALTDEELVEVPCMASRWVRLANGAKAHYMTAGDSGPSIILLHGGIAGSSGTAGWRFMAPFLGANGFRVYCPDQPGFGWADTREAFWPGDGTLSHVEFAKEFADALCLDRFFLAGNSMGADNTLQFVMTYPERVIRYILIATSSFGDNVDSSLRVPSTLTNRAVFDGTTESMRAMIEPIVYRKAALSQDLLQMRTSAANRQKESQEVLRLARQKVQQDPNMAQKLSTKDRFKKLTIPGIYLYGKDDVLAPVENGYAQEDTLSNVQLFYPEECGHQGQTDQPDMFNQVFLEFFRDGFVSRKSAEWAGVSKRKPEMTELVEQTA
jgi:2-hydroxy-6-oxonona-2,4-dienedioate hydrolase